MELLNCWSRLADGRFVSVHAFVDESRRNDTYLLAVALVSPAAARARNVQGRPALPG
ncbi:hypothetical protein [Lentzea sp. NEAU-D7]|uniref:hypothetical protein n=1 Tax=Lentzea sp. NEAU-D7 TaxID=2994667 RepID=UPI00224B115C|nr:hypothetical protein [Lentzea sp. NEAU-D7]